METIEGKEELNIILPLKSKEYICDNKDLNIHFAKHSQSLFDKDINCDI